MALLINTAKIINMAMLTLGRRRAQSNIAAIQLVLAGMATLETNSLDLVTFWLGWWAFADCFADLYLLP